VRDRLKEILLKVKKNVFTGNIGNTLTSFKGNGLDFAEIEDYVVGDDIRNINWKSTAKGMGVKVNLFNEERELNIIIAYMVNGSINFGTKRLKQEVMAEVMGFLTYSALQNNDYLTTLFFDENRIKLYKPTKKFGVLEDTLSFALNLDVVGKKTNYKNLCDFINTSKKKRSLIFIVGDFYDEVDLSTIAAKNEVYALIVRDRFEEDPGFSTEVSLVDPISLEEESICFDKRGLVEFKKAIKKHDDRLYEHFLMHQVKFKKIYTDDDIYMKISQITRD